MHRVDVRAELAYKIETPTTLLLNVAIVQAQRQTIICEELSTNPFVVATQLPVGEEHNRFHRLILQPGLVEITYTATAELEPIVEQPPNVEQIDYEALPPHVISYLNPSRYCEVDRLVNFALAEFGAMPQSFERVNAVCDWINHHLAYTPGSTNASTTACDVLILRQGVCRDFAHLGITMCRALGVPARYVSGYACQLEPPDFHGFFEVYLDGGWFLCDPTRLAPTQGLVRIGAGRDAADVAFGTIWGKAELTHIAVSAVAQAPDANFDASSTPGQAVSTA